jgi:hypothetical protein
MSDRRIRRIDELARDIPPPRDLWPSIAAAIVQDESDKATELRAASASRRRWMPAAGLAAAVVLVTVGVLIGRALGPGAQPPVVASTTNTNTTTDARMIPAALQRDAEYRRQRDQLMTEVQAKLKAMPPGERDKVAASLATLRRSIGEIEAALGKDPANALLQELLVSSCQEEMRALTAVRDAGSQET